MKHLAVARRKSAYYGTVLQSFEVSRFFKGIFSRKVSNFAIDFCGHKSVILIYLHHGGDGLIPEEHIRLRVSRGNAEDT